jgi:hypothetical protein
MIEIVNQYTKAVIRSIAADTLRQADLRRTDLSGAKQRVIRIQGSRHEINAIDGNVRVGCIQHSISEWLEQFEEIGKEQKYSEAQIAEYGAHLRHIAELLRTPWNGGAA